MQGTTVSSEAIVDHAFDGGEMAILIRSVDWSKTPLGDPSSWPYALQLLLTLVLRDREPFGAGTSGSLLSSKSPVPVLPSTGIDAKVCAALEAAEVGTFHIDLRAEQLTSGPGLNRLLGLGRVETTEPLSQFVTGIHADDREAFARAIARAREGGTFFCECRMVRSARGAGWFQWRGRLLKGPENQPTFISGVTLDVSELKALELEREQRARATELLLQTEQAARRQAEETSRLKDEFLATISHELRTPLGAILGWAQMLRQKSVEHAELERGLATIERNARTQAKLVEDILDVSRIITGKLSLRMRRIALNIAVANAIDVVRPIAELKGVKLICHMPAETSLVNADTDRLQQVVWNLLANAVKFTQRGGQVTVSVFKDGSEAVIQVCDTGLGIRPDFLPHIWERFRQGDNSTTRRYGGLGLGLAIVRSLVEAHRGTVLAESPGEGAGATFTVRLPIVSGASDLPEEEVSKPIHDVISIDRFRPELHAARVLVVDDDADTREFVSAVLHARGAEVVTVQSVAEALKGVEWFKPHVLISDVGMPEADGYDLVRCLRALPPDRGGRVPAIALTAHARSEDRQKALQAGFHMHLSKPIAVDELLRTVADAFGPSRADY